MIKDKAIDNLWITIGDYKLLSITPPPSSKLVKQGGDTLGTKDTKLSGNIVYFVPKDKKGKINGKPVRLLHTQKGYIPAEIVEPYYENILKNKSKWQSLGANDLISLAQQKVTGMGEPLASNFYGASGLVPAKTPSAYGIDSIIDLSNSSQIEEVITKPFNILDTVVSDRYVNTNVGGYRNNSFFDRTVPNYNRTDGINGVKEKKSDFYNKRGLDFFDLNLGFDGNKNSEVMNLTNSALPHGNPHNEFDLVYGVDGKNVDVASNYLGTPHSTFDIQYGVSGIEDANKQVYTAEEMADLYKKSGTKKTFKDWLSSANTQNFIDSLNNIVKTITEVKDGTYKPTTDGGKTPPADGTKDKKTEATILGMSPVTFGIVAVGSLIFASVITIYYMKNKAGKKVTN